MSPQVNIALTTILEIIKDGGGRAPLLALLKRFPRPLYTGIPDSAHFYRREIGSNMAKCRGPYIIVHTYFVPYLLT